jgi:hypothetical protein
MDPTKKSPTVTQRYFAAPPVTEKVQEMASESGVTAGVT